MKTNNKILHPELSYVLNGICFQAHKELGRFCRERQYADLFENFLIKKGLDYKREFDLNKIDESSIAGNICDFIVENKIIIDFKAKKFITKEDYFQMLRYLKSANLELGMIVNFRSTYLKPKRVLNSDFLNKKDHSEHSDVFSGHSGRRPAIALIAAIGKNRELGDSKTNKLLWHIPEDFKHFKKLTLGHPVIMGRKTFASIGKPLPERLNIIITRNPDYKAEGCLIASSLEEAIDVAKSRIQPSPYPLPGREREVFIIGGGQIFEEAIGLADKIYLTQVHTDFPQADVFFPDYSQFDKIVSREDYDNGEYKFTFLELIRPFKTYTSEAQDDRQTH